MCEGAKRVGKAELVEIEQCHPYVANPARPEDHPLYILGSSITSTSTGWCSWWSRRSASRERSSQQAGDPPSTAVSSRFKIRRVLLKPSPLVISVSYIIQVSRRDEAASGSRSSLGVPLDADRPHGVRYTLTQHDAAGQRVFGIDNAHVVRVSRGPAGRSSAAHDHLHRGESVRPSGDADTLMDDFWREVEAILKKEGIE